MKNIEIFEPAMCCPTGLCGVSVDPELLRISTVLNTLQQKGITVKRFNLSNAPMEFVSNKAVNDFVQLYGADKLPVTVVDGKLAISCRYPSNDEFTEWLDLPKGSLGEQKSGCCNGEASCCCGSDTEEESCCGGDAETEGCCCGSDAEEGSCCGGDDAETEGCCGDAPEPDGGCCCGGGR